MKNDIKNYLSLTRKDRNGVVVLLTLIVLVLLAPYAYQWLYPYKPLDMRNFREMATTLHRSETAAADSNGSNLVALFRFDPNKLPEEKWRQLGLADSQVQVIKNYEVKGGRFYSKQDLKKIYGISPENFKRLAPFINLPDRPEYEKTNDVAELNTADSARLTRVPGIGGGLAVRIIRYRDRLGGFYRKEQLKEIFGLDSISYLELAPHINTDARRIKKIALNKATLNNLMVFPYLTYKQKNAIVEYRNQHGNYKTLADLKNIPIITEETLRKIEPYISFE